MSDIFKERIRFPISESELKRRHKAVSAAMSEKNIDMLVMQNDNQFLGGYVRYFTDFPGEQAYPVTVLYEKSGEVTTIGSGAPSNPWPPAFASKVITTRLSAAYFRSLGYTDELDAELVVKTMKAKGVKRLGLVGRGLLNHVFVSYIKENGGAEIVDATSLVDRIKMIKSAEEVQFCRNSVEIHDKGMAHAKSILKAGMYEYEMRGALIKFMTELGSEEQLIMMGSAKGGELTPHLHTFYQNRRIGEGDDLVLMIEANGPGGFYCEVARTYCLGEPSKELKRMFGLSKSFQHEVANFIKPGVKASDAFKKYSELLEKEGLPPEERLFAHGQGYDLVEFPGIRADDDTVIEENMFFAIHPNVCSATAMGFCCDNYLVTKNGTELIQTTPQELIICG